MPLDSWSPCDYIPTQENDSHSDTGDTPMSTNGTSTDSRHTLYLAALAADDAWSKEGQRVFGKRWGDVRYTAQARGEPGSVLATCYTAYVTTRDAWHAA